MAQDRFELGAETWDENPGRVANAHAVAAAMADRAGDLGSGTVVDYGCGTGLVTLELARRARKAIGLDNSPAMLSVLARKAQAVGMSGVDTLEVDLVACPAPEIAADLVTAAMVLHHVPEVKPVVAKLAAMVAPGGMLALADLDTEDGSFHADATGVYHNGLDRHALAADLADLGLADVVVGTANVIERPGPSGPNRYTVFLVSGRKPQAGH